VEIFIFNFYVVYLWKENEREKVKGDIEKDIESINSEAKKRNNADFIKFIYEKYPPKNKEIKCPTILADTSYASMKKFYKNALIHYHPDKNLSDDHGFAWYFIIVEIAKHLGAFYESYK
jgi:uncharacterized Rmd1/YagE family protein